MQIISCNNTSQKEIRVYRNLTVESHFINNKPDGRAMYYSPIGRLVGITNYKLGIKNGTSINYYGNGKIKDSVTFVNDLPQGFWFNYDSLGNKIYSNYFFHGLEYGPQNFYENDFLTKVEFISFEKRVIAYAIYDSTGEFDSIPRFALNFTALPKFENGQIKYNLFAYLPDFPGVHQEYILGQINKYDQKMGTMTVKGNNFLLDTLVDKPLTGWHYFITCHIKSPNGYNKIFMEDIIYK